MAVSNKSSLGSARSRAPKTYVVYRGVPLANTKISRAARTREIYEMMKARQDAMSV
jgi:hypothetical protein